VTTSTPNGQMASSAMWAGISSAGNQVLSLVVFIIIARMVTPSEFGLVTLAMLLIDLAQILSAAGLSDAVIQRRELDDEAADTAFWTNLGLGVCFTCATLLLAAPVAALFAAPELEHVMILLSVTFLITGVGTVHTARLMREFGFRALAIRNLLASLLSGAVGISMAVSGAGADALVAQRIMAVVCMTLISWWSFRWFPRLRFAPHAFRGLVGYGMRTTGVQLVMNLNARMIEESPACFSARSRLVPSGSPIARSTP
jgi:O-antigen/teichoic acid export membrane protein